MTFSCFLNPGDWWCGKYQAGTVMTVLGSCVSVVLLHPTGQWIGVSHALLPTRQRKNEPLHARFADEVLLLFCQELSKRGLAPVDCLVYVFGGSATFGAEYSAIKPNMAEKPGIGALNIATTLQRLEQLNFKVFQQDTGGYCYRRLKIELKDGRIEHDKYPLKALALNATVTVPTRSMPSRHSR